MPAVTERMPPGRPDTQKLPLMSRQPGTAKPNIKSALALELAHHEFKVTPLRVQQRLDEISHEAQSAGQFGPAVRAEELLGRSVGMFIDRSIQLSGTMNDSHITALLELARKRQAEPIDLADDRKAEDEDE